MPSPRPLVIKYGGSLMEDPAHRRVFLGEIARLSKSVKVVLVHGGGKEITRALEKKGIKVRFVHGLRFTDEPTMAVVEDVLGRVNKDIVEQLDVTGVLAEGYSGKSSGLMRAKIISELGRVGIPEKVNPKALESILEKETIPVFFSVAFGPDDKPVNVNADDFAIEIGIACKAKRLILLTDTESVRDKHGEPILQIGESKVEALIRDGVITGGMIVKARACMKAVRSGIEAVDICTDIKGLDQKPWDLLPRGTRFVLQESPATA